MRSHRRVTLRAMPKDAQNTSVQGQLQGQLVAAAAAKNGVSEEYVRLIGFGSLEDPEFIAAIQKASNVPALWELVSPVALNALAEPTRKIEGLGFTRSDLLATLLEFTHLLRHPINQNFARSTTPLEYLNQCLEMWEEDRRDMLVQRARLRPEKARAKKTEKADAQAKRWLDEVNARKPGRSEKSVHLWISTRENTPHTRIKDKIGRYRKRIKKAQGANEK